MKTKLLVCLCWSFYVVVPLNGHCAPGGPLHKREFQLIDPAEFSGGDFGDAWDVNNLGQVVGAANTNANGQYSGFVFDLANGLRFLPVPDGAQWTLAAAINDSGEIVGNTIIDGNSHALFWSADGNVTDLHPGPDWFESMANAINDRGQVAGRASSVATGESVGFVYDPSTGYHFVTNFPAVAAMNDRGLLVGGGVYADNWFSLAMPIGSLDMGYNGRAISSSGLIVGEFTGKGYPEAFAFDVKNQHVSDLGKLPDGAYSVAFGVNRFGQVVGSADFRAALWERGQIYDLNELLIPGTEARSLGVARGINDDGYIVGFGVDELGTHAFLLIPTRATSK